MSREPFVFGGLEICTCEGWEMLSNTCAVKLKNVWWHLLILEQFDGKDATIWMDGSIDVGLEGEGEERVYQFVAHKYTCKKLTKTHGVEQD